MRRFDATKWSVGARSETGYVRTENQDRMSRVRAPVGDIYVVSDGMGGHRGGAIAAELTIQSLVQHLSAVRTTSALETAIEQAFGAANQTVYDQGHSGNAETEGMGATAVVLLAAGSHVMVAHVGDSRAYLFSRRGQLRRLTRDHSRVQRMIDSGMLTPAEAEVHPDAGLIERAIGSKPTVEVEIHPWLRLARGDQILLCSDGLCGYAEDAEIAAVLAKQGNPQEAANQLVNLALAKGGEDNITVQVLRYGGNGATGGIWERVLGQTAFVSLAAGISAATAFLLGEYLHAPELERLSALEQRTDGAEKQLLQKVEGIEQTLASSRSEITRLAERIDAPIAIPAPPKPAKSAASRHIASTKPKRSKGKAERTPSVATAQKPVTAPPPIAKPGEPAKQPADKAGEVVSTPVPHADAVQVTKPAATPQKEEKPLAAVPQTSQGNTGAPGEPKPDASGGPQQ
jgi:serine/threonine protein phosphatase PrpC